MQVSKDSVLNRLKRDDLARSESSSDIWARTVHDETGDAVLCKEIIQTFEGLLLEGNTRANAARVVGLSRKRMAEWLRVGQKHIVEERRSLEADFTWMVDRCEGEQERQLVLAAFKAAMRDGSDGALALKILERRNPDEWAPALPDVTDAGAQYAGLQKAALRDEARRVLAAAARTDETVVQVEKKGADV